jgi:hypothetical protein
MNREDIIRMAREAELIYTTHGRLWMDAGEPGEELERFAALVAAAEREACAKLLDPKPGFPYVDGGKQFCKDLAAAIRARDKV